MLAVPTIIIFFSVAFFKTDIISGEDHSVENRRQQIYLECKNDAEAQELQSMLCKLQNEHNNSLSNMSFSDNFAANYLKYPLFLLDKLDEASIAKAKADTEVSPQPKKVEDKYVSLGEKKNNIVKKADLEVISGAKPVSSDGEKIGFAKVAGMEELKETLREDVILPLQQVELYKKYGITPANGIILYGPPGTGKTFIAEALAEESGRTFLRLDVANVESKYVGETPKNIVEIFKQAEENAPSVIFIDELEALAPSRATLDSSSSAGIGYNQNVNTLLQCMNNCAEKGVFVIAATNEPQKVDSAIKRVGRIDKNIFVSPPDYMARKELFKMLLKDIYSDENINFDNLAKLTENYTAPEIKQVIIRQASLAALKQNRKVSEADIVTQIKKYTPQLDTATIEEYKKKGAKNKSEVKNQRQRIGFN